MWIFIFYKIDWLILQILNDRFTMHEKGDVIDSLKNHIAPGRDLKLAKLIKSSW